MSSDEVVAKVISEAGYDGTQIMNRSNEANYKAQLRATTKEARDIGLCGVPTYRVFRRQSGQSDGEWRQTGDLVWGQDEVAVVEDLIAGWDGRGIAQVEAVNSGAGRSHL